MTEYIEREKAIKGLDDITSDESCPMFIAAEVDQWMEFIPAADVEPVRHGYWENIVSLDDCYFATCSCCGCLIKITKTGSKWNYCPNCGAKMNKEHHNDR